LEAKQNRIRQNLLLFLSLSVSLPQFLQQFRGNNKKPARSYHQILKRFSRKKHKQKTPPPPRLLPAPPSAPPCYSELTTEEKQKKIQKQKTAAATPTPADL